MRGRPQLFGKTLFTDFLMSNLAVLLGLMMLSNVSNRQKKAKEEAGLRTEGVYAVVMDWPDASPDDVDLYVRDPSGNVVYYSARDLGLMHLEHDDQGAVSDKAKSGGGETKVEKNQERVILRGTLPGEYIVNVHMYNKRDKSPTPVTVRLVRLRGEDVDAATKVRVLAKNGDEATAFRFTVGPDGTVTDVNELQRSLMGDAPRSNPASVPPFRGGW